MQKPILFFSFIFCWVAIFSQNEICVDGSATGSENGTPANPYHTIQAAVNNASTGNIIKVAKGTYSETVNISQKKVQLLGGFSGSGDFSSADPQANVTIINGTTQAPCIYVEITTENTGSLKISGFTIRNGKRGIELTGGWSPNLNNITIENNIIENNGSQDETQVGGGIGLEGNNITIQNNFFRNNQAGRGAAIGTTSGGQYAPNNFLIADNHIVNNIGYADHAGGLNICGTGTITQNIFDGNEAAKNYDYGWGGAILIFGDENTTTSVTLSYNTYRNNSAPSRGGAIFVDDGSTVQMKHELIYHNTSKESGSAIYVDAAQWINKPSILDMSHCTISENDASGNAALFVQSSQTNIQNCIFWNNGSDFETYSEEGQPATLTVTYTLTQQDFTGTGNISSNPLFANVQNGDFHVQSTAGRFDPATGQFVNDGADSPAIDAGNPSSDYANEPQPNGGRANMGRYGNTAEASKSGNIGIVETLRATSLRIYPNPTTGELWVDCRDAWSCVSNQKLTINNVEIFDIYGQNLSPHTSYLSPHTSYLTPHTSYPLPHTSYPSPLTSIDISHFPAGLYFVKITTNAGEVVKKVVKE